MWHQRYLWCHKSSYIYSNIKGHMMHDAIIVLAFPLMLHKSLHFCRGLSGQAGHDHLVYLSPRFTQEFRCFGDYTATFISECECKCEPWPFTDEGGYIATETSKFCENLGLMRMRTKWSWFSTFKLARHMPSLAHPMLSLTHLIRALTHT